MQKSTKKEKVKLSIAKLRIEKSQQITEKSIF